MSDPRKMIWLVKTLNSTVVSEPKALNMIECQTCTSTFIIYTLLIVNISSIPKR